MKRKGYMVWMAVLCAVAMLLGMSAALAEAEGAVRPEGLAQYARHGLAWDEHTGQMRYRGRVVRVFEEYLPDGGASIFYNALGGEVDVYTVLEGQAITGIAAYDAQAFEARTPLWEELLAPAEDDVATEKGGKPGASAGKAKEKARQSHEARAQIDGKAERAPEQESREVDAHISEALAVLNGYMDAWRAQDYDAMSRYVLPSWAQSNPNTAQQLFWKHSFFTLEGYSVQSQLVSANRMIYEVNVEMTKGGTARDGLTASCTIDLYLVDGTWYLDPDGFVLTAEK